MELVSFNMLYTCWWLNNLRLINKVVLILVLDIGFAAILEFSIDIFQFIFRIDFPFLLIKLFVFSVELDEEEDDDDDDDINIDDNELLNSRFGTTVSIIVSSDFTSDISLHRYSGCCCCCCVVVVVVVLVVLVDVAFSTNVTRTKHVST